MNIPDIRCFVYLQRLIETPAKMSQCCNLLSWRATRPIYHLYLKAYILNYGTFYYLPCPRNLKGGLRSPGPEDSVSPNQPGTSRLVQGCVEAKIQRRKPIRKPVLDHKEDEGCRRICVLSSGILLIICGIPNDELALTCGSAVRTK